MQVQMTRRRLVVIGDNFIEIHKYFPALEDWKRFTKDPRLNSPIELPVGESVYFQVIYFPQMKMLKGFRVIKDPKRIFVPVRYKDQHVTEIVIRIQW